MFVINQLDIGIVQLHIKTFVFVFVLIISPISKTSTASVMLLLDFLSLLSYLSELLQPSPEDKKISSDIVWADQIWSNLCRLFCHQWVYC